MCSLAVLFFFGVLQAQSLVWGGFAYIVPSVYFTYHAFRYQKAKDSIWIFRAFMKGMMGKLMMVLMNLALITYFIRPLDTRALMAGFVLMIVTQSYVAKYIAIKLDQSSGL